MSNPKPTYTMSGSQSASVKYTINNVASAIQNVAGNIIAPMSGSGYVYAPYVPIQTTWLAAPTKALPSINLHCNNGKEKIYQFALGKSYEFLFNYMKTIKETNPSFISEALSDEDFKSALERHVYTFNPRMKLFITAITETCNTVYFRSERTGNVNDDYEINVICNEKEIMFCASELIDLLDQQIIRELP